MISFRYKTNFYKYKFENSNTLWLRTWDFLLLSLTHFLPIKIASKERGSCHLNSLTTEQIKKKEILGKIVIETAVFRILGATYLKVF